MFRRDKATGRFVFAAPWLIAKRSHWLLYALPWGPYIVIYQLSNRFPLREPTELGLTRIDQAIPFTPELLPVYVSYLAYFWWSVARCENDRQTTRLWYATHFELLISLPFFLFFPVAMPRELFYSAQVYGWADAFWRWFDAPNNCFPSLHVANVLMLMHFNRRLSHRRASTAFGLLVVASTVLVKQHYVVDVLAGACVYLAARWFLTRLELPQATARSR